MTILASSVAPWHACAHPSLVLVLHSLVGIALGTYSGVGHEVA